jgi:hypothetical protein
VTRRPPWLDEADAIPVDDQAARLAAQLAEHDRRQAIKRATRADFAAARTAGLRARHTAKLARLDPAARIAKPCGCTSDRLCPQHIDALPRAERGAARCNAGHHNRACPKTCPQKNPETTAAPPPHTTPAQTPDTATHTQRRTP